MLRESCLWLIRCCLFVSLHSRQQVYGPNLISVPVKSYMSLLVDEVRRGRIARIYDPEQTAAALCVVARD